VFTDCTAVGGGGAMETYAQTITYTDCDFARCIANKDSSKQQKTGGALYVKSGASVNLYDDSYISGNTVGDNGKGAGIYLEQGATLRIKGNLGFGGPGVRDDGEAYELYREVNKTIQLVEKGEDGNAKENAYTVTRYRRYYVAETTNNKGQKTISQIYDKEGTTDVYYAWVGSNLYRMDEQGNCLDTQNGLSQPYEYMDPKTDEVVPGIPNVGNYCSEENEKPAIYNGYKPIRRYRQDVYIAGYPGVTADSLILVDDITSGDGSIWVYAEKNPHYLQNEQFAKLLLEQGKTELSDEETTMKAFRNARSDNDTGNGTETFLSGELNGSDIHWNGVKGTRRVILKKVGEHGMPLIGTKFTIYKGTNEIPIQVPDPNNPAEKVTFSDYPAGTSGLFWIGDLTYGVYYIKETNVPEGYVQNNDDECWFYMVVDETGVQMSEGYLSRDAAKTAYDAAAAQAAADSNT
jgi:hypothetical protein